MQEPIHGIDIERVSAWLVDHIDGKPVDLMVDTGVTLVTPENIDDPEINELLNPPLDEYLNP